jgi:hypothetical protein
VPPAIANAICGVYLAYVARPPIAIQMYDLARCSHATALTRLIARRRGIV